MYRQAVMAFGALLVMAAICKWQTDIYVLGVVLLGYAMGVMVFDLGVYICGTNPNPYLCFEPIFE